MWWMCVGDGGGYAVEGACVRASVDQGGGDVGGAGKDARSEGEGI